MDYKNKGIYLQNTSIPTDLEKELMVTRREPFGGGIVMEFGINVYKLLYLK